MGFKWSILPAARASNSNPARNKTSTHRQFLYIPLCTSFRCTNFHLQNDFPGKQRTTPTSSRGTSPATPVERPAEVRRCHRHGPAMPGAGAQPLRRQGADAGPGPTGDLRTARRPGGTVARWVRGEMNIGKGGGTHAMGMGDYDDF